MTTIVTDKGFGPDDWTGPVTDLGSDADQNALQTALDAQMIRIDFPSFKDGRGFTLARRLRLMGYQGHLRAQGHVLADQYAMARRSGFDDVQIDADLAARQPEEQWTARADWQAHHYQARLRG